MAKRFTMDQVTHLRGLEEARIGRGGEGMFDEFQAFIRQLESGGLSAVASKDIRKA